MPPKRVNISSSRNCEYCRRKRPETCRSASGCALPPTRLTLRPTSTAGRWFAANRREVEDDLAVGDRR